ncbi:DUF5977 domain-containing protein [Chryseobacterium arthrosphaerae]|uniref:DUF5977 domain-containing protein n=1 Tax=Chryseobacterium arthrosphaerae TaxID=651561 RepID=UPI003D349F6D
MGKYLILTKIIFITLFSYLSCILYGQANYSNYYFPEPPKAPSSQTFLKYGDINNNEYLGRNNPSINLFNLRSGDINLPVNLNYISGSGVRVMDEAGQVGLGWDIGFPTIVQSIYGYDDFSDNIRYRLDFAKSSLPYASTFPLANGPTNFNDLPSFNTYGYYIATNNNVPRNGMYTSLSSNFDAVDMQPDIFVMNLFGEKVEFLISNFEDYNANNNGSITFTALNKKGYKFEKTSLGFTIKDPKGFTYKFNNVEDIINSSKAVGRNFHISEIIDTNNKKILFQYISTSLVTNLGGTTWFLNYTTNYSNNNCKQGSSNYLDFYNVNDPAPVPNPNRFGGLNDFLVNSSGSDSQQKYLFPSNIISDNGKLIFNYSDRADFNTKKLDKITLLTNNDVTVSEYKFQYDYFLSQVVDTSNLMNNSFNSERNKRLKLNSIQKNNDEKYSFYYNETLLPPKMSYAIDYWGYSNGGFTNKTIHLNPTDFNYNINIPVTEINNNKKIPNINYTQSGILEKIEYPTKGSSVFIYELNEASNLFYLYNKYKHNKGNGLRLKEQRNYDSNNQLLTTIAFEYQNGLTPNPINMIREDNGEVFFEIGDCAGRPVVKTRQGSFVSMQSSSISSTFSLSSGNNVGYSKVIKKEIDGAGNNKGRTETLYSNNEDIHFGIASYNRPIFLPSVKGNKIENGSILKNSYFNSNSLKLKEEKYNYIVQNSPFSYGVTMIHPMFYVYVLNSFGTGSDPSFVQHYKSAVGYYPIYSTETILQNKETIDYFGTDSLVTKTNFSYNSYNQIKSKLTEFPDGESNIENIKYSTEKNNTKLFNANILSVPLETEVIRNTVNGIAKRTSLMETKYDNSAHLNPTSVLSFDISNNVATTEINYDLYDNGNILQYTTKQNIPTTIIWGYNKTQIIAKIEGARYSQVMQAFGLDPNNSSSYLQLDIVKKSDLDIDDSSENDLISKLNDFRTKTEFKDFKITTYTYDPLIGVKTITSASGFKEYYKYDPSNNRLEKILDSENKIIKEYKYNYALKKYYNSIKSETFTRNNCGSNAVGSSYIYTVPANTYYSYVSQADADQKAQDEINTNGQNMANLNGICTALNCNINMFISGGGGISLANTTNYKIQMGFSSGVGNPWTTSGVIVGKINGSCLPQTEKNISGVYSNGFLWNILIRTNGELLVKKVEGLGVTGVPDNTSYYLEFTYPTN